jgi:hypothetical protein
MWSSASYVKMQPRNQTIKLTLLQAEMLESTRTISHTASVRLTMHSKASKEFSNRLHSGVMPPACSSSPARQEPESPTY